MGLRGKGGTGVLCASSGVLAGCRTWSSGFYAGKNLPESKVNPHEERRVHDNARRQTPDARREIQ
jgi:hypothetical protein